MNTPPTVSPQEWKVAREELLVEEKELTHARDALAAKEGRIAQDGVEPGVLTVDEHLGEGQGPVERVAGLEATGRTRDRHPAHLVEELPNGPGDLGQPLGPEDDESQDGNDQDLERTDLRHIRILGWTPPVTGE